MVFFLRYVLDLRDINIIRQKQSDVQELCDAQLLNSKELVRRKYKPETRSVFPCRYLTLVHIDQE